jgi:2-C-methyl-D-erythritol 4-phosphate cytidylyltransferase
MVSVIIVAAGQSRRMGFDKLFAKIHGRPVLYRTIDTFSRCSAIDEIILVCHSTRQQEIHQQHQYHPWPKLSAIVPGGAERPLSVLEGLRAASPQSELIAIHDGARPLTGLRDIERVIDCAREHGAASLAHPIVDTVKRTNDTQAIIAEVDRTHLWGMETPQVFRRSWLVPACEYALEHQLYHTDEVTTVIAHGHPVKLIASTKTNFKITHQPDMELAEALFSTQYHSLY